MQITLEYVRHDEIKASCLAEARITARGNILVYSVDETAEKTPYIPKDKGVLKFNENGCTRFSDWRVRGSDVEMIKAIPKKEVKERAIKEYAIVVYVKAKTMAGAKSALTKEIGYNDAFEVR